MYNYFKSQIFKSKNNEVKKINFETAFHPKNSEFIKNILAIVALIFIIKCSFNIPSTVVI